VHSHLVLGDRKTERFYAAYGSGVFMRTIALLAGILGCSLLTGCGGGGSSADTSNNPNVASGGPPAPSTIAGVVTDTNGAPISGVTITAFLTNENNDRVTTTDANGAYSFANLSASYPYGNYELRAEKLGYAFYASVGNPAGAVIKSDYNALFRMVVALPSHGTVHAVDANFTAMRTGEKLLNLPRTGQTVSYASGDDGSAIKGVAWPTNRFTDNGDGTINDALTGLIWLKDAACFTMLHWNEALTSAAQLGNGACGLTDGSVAGQWRMPNSTELESLVDVSRSNPAISTGNPFVNIGATYWSSTTYRGVTSNAWVIRITDGRYINDSSGNDKTSALNGLWAVKSPGNGGAIKLPATGQFIVYATGDDASVLTGKRLTSPRFIDNGNGTVSDSVTGLTWLKQANCIRSSWSSAIASIDILANGQCGLTDGSTAGQWRMPNRTELLSLVDRAETNQALRFNSTFFKTDGSVDQSVIFNSYIEFEFYWTATTDAADTTMAWTVFSCDYGVYDIDKSSLGYTLAVR
jgi:hypothetical protein